MFWSNDDPKACAEFTELVKMLFVYRRDGGALTNDYRKDSEVAYRRSAGRSLHLPRLEARPPQEDPHPGTLRPGDAGAHRPCRPKSEDQPLRIHHPAPQRTREDGSISDRINSAWLGIALESYTVLHGSITAPIDVAKPPSIPKSRADPHEQSANPNASVVAGHVRPRLMTGRRLALFSPLATHCQQAKPESPSALPRSLCSSAFKKGRCKRICNAQGEG